MIVTTIICTILVLAFISQTEERLLYIENYLRQILDILRELKSKRDD